MKFLIVGLGSMGKRRVRNLQQLKAGEVVGFDVREDRCREANERYGVRVYEKFEGAMKENPDALVICTPPDLHLEYQSKAAHAGKHFFTEAGLLVGGLDELIASTRNKNLVAAPSCTMRFQPSIRRIKSLVDAGTVGNVLAFTYHVGQYLPDWHPYEDYRGYYVARRQTGACREIVPFEFVWLTWVLGDITSITCVKDKLTTLEADIDDAYHMIVRMGRRALGSILVDVISRVPYRQLKLLGEEGVVTWDWTAKLVRVFSVADRRWYDYPEAPGVRLEGYVAEEDMYVSEMAHFVAACHGEIRYMHTLEEDRQILGLLLAAEESSASGSQVMTRSHLG